MINGPLSDDALFHIILNQLTANENSRGIVYLADAPAAVGTTLDFPHLTIKLPWSAELAFIDSDPAANWGHHCRYLLINRETGEIRSLDAMFPPFRPEENSRWKIIYKGPASSENT